MPVRVRLNRACQENLARFSQSHLLTPVSSRKELEERNDFTHPSRPLPPFQDAAALATAEHVRGERGCAGFRGSVVASERVSELVFCGNVAAVVFPSKTRFSPRMPCVV